MNSQFFKPDKDINSPSSIAISSSSPDIPILSSSDLDELEARFPEHMRGFYQKLQKQKGRFIVRTVSPDENTQQAPEFKAPPPSPEENNTAVEESELMFQMDDLDEIASSTEPNCH